MTCNDAYASIVRTIDDARLTGEERTALRRHLVSCARCRAEYETQHEVRRLLVLHIQDQLPAGFDARLNARLARASRPLPSATARLLQVHAKDVWHHGTRGRVWALRLIPFAATIALIVASNSSRDVAPPPGVPSASAGAASFTAGTTSVQPRAFTTIEIPRRDDGATRHHPPSFASADDVAHIETPPAVADNQPHESEAIANSKVAIEDLSKAVKVVPGAPDLADRVRDSEWREPDRGVNGELAVSQRPGILPRPAAPFPQGRPAMPAPTPPVVVPDRSIPPW